MRGEDDDLTGLVRVIVQLSPGPGLGWLVRIQSARYQLVITHREDQQRFYKVKQSDLRNSPFILNSVSLIITV